MFIIVMLILGALDLFVWAVIISVLMSWLVAFDVLNLKNKWVYKGYMLLNSIVCPPMEFLRRYIPPIGGIDLSPMVLIFGIYFIQGWLRQLLY